MPENKKKFKVIISENVTKKMTTLSNKDQKKLMKAIEEIAENPLKGEPMDLVALDAMEAEKCKKCELSFQVMWDRNSDEVHFWPQCEHEESFWMTKQEVDEGREKYLKKRSNLH